MKRLKLKNGSIEVEPIIRATMMSLSSLLESNPIAFFEAVMIARDQNHKPFGNTDQVLRSSAIIDEQGKMHTSVRNVILSGVVGEMLQMRLSSPVEGEL